MSFLIIILGMIVIFLKCLGLFMFFGFLKKGILKVCEVLVKVKCGLFMIKVCMCFGILEDFFLWINIVLVLEFFKSLR